MWNGRCRWKVRCQRKIHWTNDSCWCETNWSCDARRDFRADSTHHECRECFRCHQVHQFIVSSKLDVLLWWLFACFLFRDKPLALYIFSDNESDRNVIISNTQSGGVCCNDTIMHLAGKQAKNLNYFASFLNFKCFNSWHASLWWCWTERDGRLSREIHIRCFHSQKSVSGQENWYNQRETFQVRFKPNFIQI